MFKITQPITETELQVANQDFPNEMTWTEAIACSELKRVERIKNS